MADLPWDRFWRAMDQQSSMIQQDGYFQIETPQALSQIAGYVKYALRSNDLVYFRGQHKDYNTLLPSIYRGKKSLGKADRNVENLSVLLKEMSDKKVFLNGTPKELREAVLQHYGIFTRYMDFVDNIWCALWFSCWQAMPSKDRKYLHYEKSRNNYSYIYLLKFGKAENVKSRKIIPGILHTDKGFEVIDLRMALPSTYLRPHSQHAIVIRKKTINKIEDANFQNHVEVVLRINTNKALSWLGVSNLTDVRFMFPPPYYDSGYNMLLSKNVQSPKELGNIFTVCA